MENNFQTIQDILKQRFAEYQKDPQETLKKKSKEYQKNWNDAVNYFLLRINKDQKKQGKPEYTFIRIRMRLVALREIDDLRWFYRECLRYSNTYEKKLVNGKPVRNTFSKCFFGATKVK